MSSPPTTESKDESMSSGDYYFDSYSHFGIHEEMLKDTVRTEAYMYAIKNNPQVFKDKVVLDVGCGTGILCMFAAQAGAKQVIGVECAEIYHQAKKIVALNKLDHIVTLVKGKIEEVVLPVDKVDIIISEWMGYFLLYESMLDSVLYARDKWLNPNGCIFPDKAQILMCAIEDEDYRHSKLDFWDDVYGFDYSAIKKLALLEPLVDTCEDAQVTSSSCPIMNIDINTVTKEDLDFDNTFSINITDTNKVHALVGYFNVTFDRCHVPISFSTGPMDKYTHWKQTVFYLKEPLDCEEGDVIEGRITCTRNAKNPRDLDVNIESWIKGKTKPVTQEFRIR